MPRLSNRSEGGEWRFYRYLKALLVEANHLSIAMRIHDSIPNKADPSFIISKLVTDVVASAKDGNKYYT